MNSTGFYKNKKHLLESVWAVMRNKYPARHLKVIGVTGTDGKTTTTHLVYSIFQKAKLPVAMISTVAAYKGDEKIDTGFHVTTPDAKFLQPLLKKFVQEKVKYLILETTSHGLDQHRVLGCNFFIGVLTNISHEHLDYHQTFEKYQGTKAKLFRKVKYAVLNKDDSSFSFVKKKTNPGAKIITYGLKEKARIGAKKIKLTSSGMTFRVYQGKKSYGVKTRLIGDYNVANILAAIGVAKIKGISWENILKALEEFSGISGRMEPVDMGQDFSVLVDFAHTPNALEKILNTLKALKSKKNRLIVVFGCAGERDYLKRPMMGKIAVEKADLVVLTAEDPRAEKVEEINKKIIEGCQEAGGVEKKTFFSIPDRQKAIDFAIKLARKKDIVVLCGKGHEKSMCFGKTEKPWSDQKAVEKTLKKIKRKQNGR